MTEVSARHTAGSRIHEVLDLWANTQPDTMAFRHLAEGEVDGVRQDLTYGALRDRSLAIAGTLTSLLPVRSRVLLSLDAGPEFITAFLGCLFADVIPVPIGPWLGGRFEATLASIGGDAGASLTLVGAADDRGWAAASDAGIRPVRVADIASGPGMRPASGSVAFLQYTSGTTSHPRGVRVTHANVMANLDLIARSFELARDDVMVTWLPPHHDMGLIGTLLMPLALGASIVAMSPAHFVARPARWVEAIAAFGGTISGGPDFAYDLCARAVDDADVGRLDLSTWNVAFNGSEPVRPSTLRSFSDRFAAAGFRSGAFLPCYGLAESTLLVAGRVSPDDGIALFGKDQLGKGRAAAPEPGEEQLELVACDLLVASTVVIVDDDGAPLADGAVGRILIHSPSVADGYWNAPDATAASFSCSVAGHPGAFLDSGDVGFVSGGQLFVRGRMKDLLIVRGVNHHPAEVEASARRAIGAKGRTAAVQVDRGGREELVLCYETATIDAAQAAAISESVRSTVAADRGIQVDHVVAVAPRSIPVTTSGKVRRRELRAQLEAGSVSILADDPHAPMTKTAAEAHPGRHPTFATVLSAVLQRPIDETDLLKPLTALGLDSLKAIELQHRLEIDLGVEVDLANLLGDVPLADFDAVSRPIRPLIPVEHPPVDAPLSAGQRLLSFQAALAADPDSLHLSRAVQLSGALDTTAFHQAVEAVVRRHAALRTVGLGAGPQARQRWADATNATVVLVDLRNEDTDVVTATIERAVRTPFGADEALLRATLLRIADHEHIMVLTSHHSVMDLWSLGVVVGDLLLAYERPGALDALPTPPHPAEFVAWQEDVVASPATAELAARWAAELADAPPLDVFADRPVPRFPTFRGGDVPVVIGSDRLAAIDQAAERLGTSRSSLLAAAWAAVLGRFAGQDDLILGMVHSGRTRARFAELVGYAVNLVPIRVALPSQARVAEVIGAVHRWQLTSLDRNDIPFGRLIEASPKREGGVSRLLTATFTYQAAPGLDRLGLVALACNHDVELPPWAGLSVRVVPVPQHANYFELALYLGEYDHQLIGTVEYSIDRFDQASAAAIAGAFDAALDEIAEDPDRLLCELTMARAVDECASGEANVVVERPIHELIAAKAAADPSAVTLIDPSGPDVTRAELDERANRAARLLVDRGVRPGDRVVVLMERSVDAVVAILGVLKAAAAYVPLDPIYPAKRLKQMIDDAAPAVVLADPSPPVDLTGQVVLHPGDAAALPSAPLDLPVDLDAVAYVVFTSGSTGRPKGVKGTHRGITNRQAWLAATFPSTPTDIGSFKTSLAFVDSIGELLFPLSEGFPLVVAPTATGRDPLELLDLLEREAVTRLVVVPSLLRSLLDLAPDLAHRLRSLRFCHSSGEALSRDVADRFLDAVPTCTLVNLYGSSEVAADVTAGIVERGPGRPSIGRPIANIQIHILDPGGHLVPNGAPGEIYVGGAGVALGYLHRPELTAERFVPDPFTAHGTLFRTGDLGRRLPDGSIDYLGRSDDQLEVRGHRVELGDVEAALRRHPEVAEAVVAARADDRGGNDLVAAIVLRCGPSADAEADNSRIDAWTRLYDELYEKATGDEARQIWTSSVTGEPFSTAEIQEWMSSSTRRILELGGEEVLELGCGTGEVARVLAPHVRSYLGIDPSNTGIEAARRLVSDRHCRFRRQDATCLDVVEPARADVVVLNSVIQYFPSATYLAAAAEAAESAARPGGAIYFGDVRALGSHEAFHTAAVIRKLDTPTTAKVVRGLIAERVAAEEELLVAPDWFRHLVDRRAALDRCDLLVRRGRHRNELLDFRYDAIVRLGPATRGTLRSPVELDAGEHDLATWRGAIAANPNRPVVVRGIRNERLAPVIALVEYLATLTPDAIVEPDVAVECEAAADPEDLWTLGAGLGREVELHVAGDRCDRIDLRVWPVGSHPHREAWPTEASPETVGSSTNDPMVGKRRAAALASIRTHLRDEVPEFMVPAIRIVDHMPRTESGKANRSVVAAGWPVRRPSERRRDVQPGRTLDAVAAAWHDALGHEDVTADENFFDVGGNSLSLVEVHLALQELAGAEFPLVDLYDRTTMAEHGALVDALRSSPARTPVAVEHAPPGSLPTEGSADGTDRRRARLERAQRLRGGS